MRFDFVAAAAVTALATVSLPAHATTTARGYAPDCVKRYHGTGQYANGSKWWHIQVANRCGRVVRVKVTLKLKRDLPCVTLGNGQSFSRYGDGGDPYQSTRTC